MSTNPNYCKATLISRKMYRIVGDITKENKLLVIIPLVIPEGPDWEWLDAEKFSISRITVRLDPYYTESSLTNRTIGNGVISGQIPLYVQFFNGNTYKENQPIDMSQIIYDGRYATGYSTSSFKITYDGKVFKTMVNEAGEVTNKEVVIDEAIDASLLENAKVNLQIGHVAVSVRPEDFKVNFNSVNNSSNEYMRKHMLSKEQREIKEDHIEVKKSKKRNPPNPDTPDQPDDTNQDNPDADIAPITSIYPEPLSSKGSLMVDVTGWVTAEYDIVYTRNATSRAKTRSSPIVN